jgi:hypothetical protein
MRWVFLGLVVGCDEVEPSDVAAGVDEPLLTIGVGEHGFERAIGEGDALPLVSGSQGGQHVFLAVRTAGFVPGRRMFLSTDEDIPTFHVVWTDSAGTLYGEQWIADRAMEGDPVEAELALGRVFVPEFWGTGDGDTYGYAPPADLVLRVEAEDACGNLLESDVAILL